MKDDSAAQAQCFESVSCPAIEIDKCRTSVFYKYKRESHKSFPQECPTTLPYKCQARVSHEGGVLQECRPECPSRVSLKSVLTCQTMFGCLCLHMCVPRVRGLSV